MPDSTVTPLPYDIWIRVSQVNGRAGDSYRSPSDQREICAALAKELGVPVGEVIVKEDLSGSKAQKDPDMQRLVQKVKDKKSGGLLCWDVTRYSRNQYEGLRTAIDIMQAGGRVYSTDFKYEGSMALGILGFLLGKAQDDLESKTATWARAVKGSVDRGLNGGSVKKTLFGFDWPTVQVGVNDKGEPIFKKTGVMQPHPENAAIVLAAAEDFDRGMSGVEIRRKYGRKIDLRNVAYIGWAHNGEGVVNKDAHEAILPEDLFWRIQARLDRQAAEKHAKPRERTASDAALQGILKCRCHGWTLSPDLDRDRNRWFKVKNHKHDCQYNGRGIREDQVLDLVIAEALRWHSVIQPRFAAVQDAEKAMVPVLYEQLQAVRDEKAEVEASSLSALRKAQALDTLDAQETKVQGEIATALANTGFLALDSETVKAEIAGDVEKTRRFLGETLRVFIDLSDEGKQLPIEQRLSFSYVCGGEGADDVGAPATEAEVDEAIVESAERKTGKSYGNADEALTAINASRRRTA